ncbi:hypothetical protein RY27_04665 [Litorilinea aerophila]|nr:hypothetical protein RY27_04665 [Litorilinea aerophila]
MGDLMLPGGFFVSTAVGADPTGRKDSPLTGRANLALEGITLLFRTPKDGNSHSKVQLLVYLF